MRWLLACALVLLVACAKEQRTRRPVEAVRAPAPATQTGPARAKLYEAAEALRDILSSPLQHVGTGRWPGIQRSYTCVFRNERVLVVDVYCGVAPGQAVRVDVYSEKRGRVSIYAEGKVPIASRRRADYFTFMTESTPLPDPATRLVAPTLLTSFAALYDYERRRYEAFLPVCYGGQERGEQKRGCMGALAAREPEWIARNGAFFDRASEDWYRVVAEVRTLAVHHGRDPD